MIVLDHVAIRIKHDSCPKCGSKNIVVTWRCGKPNVVSYECLDCKEVHEEPAE